MTFEAELGRAVSRGLFSQTMADVAIFGRYQNIEDARRSSHEVRRSALIWTHIRDQLVLRIRDVTRANAQRHAPRNVILAQAHEINRSQTLSEQDVNEIVITAIWDCLPNAPRRRRHA